MQFKREQQAQMRANWNSDSWFFVNLGTVAREVVESAYGLSAETPPKRQAASQESLSLVMSVFARRIGAEKSQVVHALLSGRIEKLLAAMRRKPGAQFSVAQLADEWQNAFREVTSGTL